MDTFACCKAFQSPSLRWSTRSSFLYPRVHLAFLTPRHGGSRARMLQHRKEPLVLCRMAGHEENRARKQQQRRQQQGKEVEEPVLQDTSSKPAQEHVNSGRRRFFALRLRGRIRLALRQLRRWSPLAILQAILRYARVHSKQVALSTLFGCIMTIGCLCLKLSSTTAPHVVPYSELVSRLRSGAVSTVLFEEGSRQLFFNLRTASEPTTECEAEAHEDMYKQGITKEHEDSHQQVMVQGSGTQLYPTSIMQDGMDKAARMEPNSRKASVVSMVLSSLKSVATVPEQLLKSEAHSWKYSTRRIDNDEAYLLSLMRDKGVMYSSAPQPMSAALRTTLITILSLWIPLTPLFWLMHRQFSGGNAAAQRRRVISTSVKFEDVAGVDEAKVELTEIVSYLCGATNFRKIGAKLPRGVLLVGPPGTGKTLLARAVAGEARVPFFAASASEFVEMFVGRGAARIRELFTGARKCAPSIIFIDELDAVGGRRGRSFNDERDQTLNQLLTEMDGFESETGVLVIAATNRPEALDPALCRPGRFSRKVFVREPDLKGRQQVLAVHMRGVPVDGDAELIQTAIASITQGFVGADLANVVNEAALLAVREGRLAVALEDFKAAVNRVKYGIGNQPGFVEREVSRVFELFQSKVLTSAPAGYGTAPWSG